MTYPGGGQTGGDSTASDAYLIVAHYNFAMWKTLDPEEHGKAEKTAKQMFPAYTASYDLPYLQGVLAVDTFQSDIFARLSVEFEKMDRPDKISILDPIYEDDPPYPPVGWMAVVDESYFLSFIGLMSSNGGHLWRMFDIEIHPLPAGWTKKDLDRQLPSLMGDKKTDQIYWHMTPTNWKT
jgi:hypothetical protein